MRRALGASFALTSWGEIAPEIFAEPPEGRVVAVDVLRILFVLERAFLPVLLVLIRVLEHEYDLTTTSIQLLPPAVSGARGSINVNLKICILVYL